MAVDIKQYTDFLHSLGTDNVEHSGEGFFAHLVAVYRDLKKWGADDDVCLAGMFHSIYGTEKFSNFGLPIERRDELRDLIGERAERLAYYNCCMDRTTYDKLIASDGKADPLVIGDRLMDTTIQISSRDFEDLRTIQICDWLEQVGRSKDWDYRRESYRTMALQIGGIAEESYQRVFALEPAS